MESRQQRDEVRKTCPISTQRAAFPVKPPAAPSGMRIAARGCYPAGQGGNAVRLDVSRGQWFIDVFSGAGGAARALR
eukprot:1963630-Pyramimonas_sp.AAC.1